MKHADIPSVSVENTDMYDDKMDECETRADAFIHDTEQAIKIFFSSYFLDKGLMWFVCALPASGSHKS